MAYTPYSDDQIRSFFSGKGSASTDPWALRNYSLQYNADPEQVARVQLGLTPQQTQQGLASMQQQLSGPIAGARDLDATNPHMAYALAQHRGDTAGQADSFYGLNPGGAAGWAQAQGYTGFGSAPVGGAPAAPAAPNPYLPAGSSGVSSGAGTGPAGTPLHKGVAGVPGYMTEQQTDRSGNVLPAGGRGSNYGNDPRIGGPGRWANPLMGSNGIGGLMRYLSDNPSMLAVSNELTRQVNNNLTRNALPQIRRNAMVDGVAGGSGQGIAEGLAIGESNASLAGALAKLYGDQFNTDRGFGLQNDALDFQIHQGNQQSMRQGQFDTLGFLGQMLGWNQQGVGVATQVQNTPLTRWQQFADTGRGIGGLGSSNTQQLQGNPFLGAVGGWMTGQKMFGG